MNRRTTSLSAIGLAGLLIAPLASGAERGFYVGLMYGQTKHDSTKDIYEQFVPIVYENLGFAPETSTVSLDTSDSGYGFFGGFRLSEYFAIEGGYLDLGETTYLDQSDGISHRDDKVAESGEVDHSADVAQTWTQKLRTPVKGISMSALGIWPITYRSEVFARGGMLLSTSELRLSVTDGQDRVSNRPDQHTALDFLVGGGFAFTFAEIYALRLEYQRIIDAAHEDTDERDVDMVSVGITVMF
jgi:hypothetical protein